MWPISSIIKSLKFKEGLEDMKAERPVNTSCVTLEIQEIRYPGARSGDDVEYQLMVDGKLFKFQDKYTMSRTKGELLAEYLSKVGYNVKATKLTHCGYCRNNGQFCHECNGDTNEN